MRRWLIGLACFFYSSVPAYADHPIVSGPAGRADRVNNPELLFRMAAAEDCLDVRATGNARPAPKAIEFKNAKIDIWRPAMYPHDPRPQPARCLAE